MFEPLRAVVAEDSPLLRRGIEEVLVDAGVAVVGSFPDADSMLAAILDEGLTLDVAVVDIRMPPTFTDEGLAALERIREAGIGAGVVLLSMYVDPSYVIRALAAGHERVGYLLKDRVSDVEAFVAAITRVADGGSAIDPMIVETMAARPATDDRLRRLTDRERDVLRLVAEGHSNRSIAALLVINDKTVETHITHIFQKLDLGPSTDHHRRVLAALRWLDR